MTRIRVGGWICLVLLWAPTQAFAYFRARPDTSRPAESHQLIVRLKSSSSDFRSALKPGTATTGLAGFDSVSARMGVSRARPLLRDSGLKGMPRALRDVILIDIPPGQAPETMIDAYEALEIVEYAESDRPFELFDALNDPLYEYQWALNNFGQPYYHILRIDGPGNDVLTSAIGLPDADIDAQEVFDRPVAGGRAVVAIIDTGVDTDHPDLADRIWVNPGEIPGNRQDDDHNGFVDDVQGWDFSGDYLIIPPPEVGENDPSDQIGHGTHCAGIVGAVTNNAEGIAGITGDCRIMPLKVFPTALNSVAARAIVYAVENGADVINMSWGAPWHSRLLEEVLEYARRRGVILCAASGNNGSDQPMYPAAFPGVIAVGATDSRDHVTYFSSWGEHLDLVAPGLSILSLRAASTDLYSDDGEPGVHIISDRYYLASGTSMAAPFVAGVATYMRAHSPGLSPDAARSILTGSVDDLTDPYGDGQSLSGRDVYSGYGRLNFLSAITGTPSTAARIDYPRPHELVSGTVSIVGIAWTDAAMEYVLEYGSGSSPSEWTEIGRGPAVVTDDALGAWNTAGLSGIYTLRLRVGESNAVVVTVYAVNATAAQFDTPGNGDTVVAWTEVAGTAQAPDFASYRVEVGEGTSPDLWELVARSTVPVSGGELTIWYAGDRPDGLYTFRLSVFSNSGIVATALRTVFLKSRFSYAGAWKVPLEVEGPATVASYGDFDLDGALEIVVGTGDGLRFVNADGTPDLVGIPEMDENFACQTPVVVGDVDGDGRDDLVVVSDDGRLHVFPSSEQSFAVELPYPPRVSALRGIEAHLMPQVFLKDVDGDGRDDIHYFPGWTMTSLFDYYIFDADGSLRLTLPRSRFARAAGFCDYLPADLNNDGQDELYMASDWLYRVDLSGQVMDSLDLRLDSAAVPTTLSMSAVDIDRDGRRELILLATLYQPGGTHWIYAFDENLAPVPGWPHNTGIDYFWTTSEPVFCDVDGDGIREYFMTWFDTERGRVSAWHADGTTLGGLSDFSIWTSTKDPAKLRTPVAADVTGDGFADIVACATEDMYLTFRLERLVAFDRLGRLLPGWPVITESFGQLPGSGWRYTTAVGDIDRNGVVDVMMTTSANHLVLVNLDAPYDSSAEIVPFCRYDRSLCNSAPLAGHFEVVAVTPTRLQPEIPGDVVISIEVSHELDVTSLLEGVEVAGSITGVKDGVITCDAARRRLDFIPNTAFADGETVLVRVRSDVRSAAGMALGRDFHARFVVNARIPAVAAAEPTAHQTELPVGTPVRIQFNTPLDRASIHDSSIIVYGDLTGIHTGEVDYDSASCTLHLQPHADFLPGERVTVVVRAGIRSLHGIRMAHDYAWWFVVAPPRIASVRPLPQSFGAPRYSYVTASFDGPVPASAVHESTFVVYSPTRGRLRGTVGYIPTTRTARFTPDQAYPSGEYLTVAVPYVRNVWSFNVNGTPGPGTFLPPVSYDQGGPARCIAIADADDDGDVDLLTAVTSAGEVRCLTNSGAGTFVIGASFAADSVQCVLPVDLDADGDVDLVTVSTDGRAAALFRAGGTFTQQWSSSLTGTFDILAVDLDGNGYLDVCTEAASVPSITLLFNDGGGLPPRDTTLAMPGVPMCTAPLDLEGDGDVDLVVCDSSGTVVVLHNNGSGALVVSAPVITGNGGFNMTGHDFDRDGDADLAALQASGRVSIIRNDGTGELTRVPVGTIPGAGHSIRSADVDADGDPDLIVGSDERVYIMSNLGDGTFGEPRAIPVADTVLDLAVTDLDADGDLDLATGGTRVVSFVFNQVSSSVGDDEGPLLPAEYALGQNYPNPFNPATTIQFALPEPGHVKLEVFNLLGRRVTVLVDETMAPGYYTRTWHGGAVASGVYFYRLEAGSFRQTRRMLLVK